MEDEVRVHERPDGTFDVEVRHPEASRVVTTRHAVTVPPGLAAALGRPDLDPAALVRASFAFLLEREPPTSILARFSLDVIGDYFPEYGAELRRAAPAEGLG